MPAGFPGELQGNYPYTIPSGPAALIGINQIDSEAHWNTLFTQNLDTWSSPVWTSCFTAGSVINTYGHDNEDFMETGWVYMNNNSEHGYFEDSLNLLSALVASKNYLVPDEADYDTGIKINGQYYYTLQSAINAASPGDEIYLKGGEKFKESVELLNKTNITICSDDPGNPAEIEYKPRSWQTIFCAIKITNSSNIHLENIDVAGRIKISESDNCTIDGVYVWAYINAVSLVYSNDITVKNSTILSGHLLIGGSSNINIYRNYISAANAIESYETSGLKVYHNMLRGHGTVSGIKGTAVIVSTSPVGVENDLRNNIIWDSHYGFSIDNETYAGYNCLYLIYDDIMKNGVHEGPVIEENALLVDRIPTQYSPVIDEGCLLPGINDDYVGAAPDIGLNEYGSDINFWMYPVWYNKGDMVIFNGEIWECDIAHWSYSSYSPGAPGIWLWLRPKLGASPYEWKLLTQI